MGEKDPGTICGSPAPPGTQVRFECADNDFSCGTFTCTDVYSKCGTSKNDFSCQNNFDCNGGGAGGEQFYDCWDFNCGAAGGATGAFDCDTKFDFMCLGTDFDCADDFDCNGGHIFLCSTDHECADSFGCSSGGTACDANYPYNLPDGGGTDGTPGDFLCGGVVGDGNNFECHTDFDCSAEDEFDCRGETNFDCTGDFDCGAAGGATEFECDTDFDCKPEGDFDCITDFDCTADGGAGGTFECTDDFDCGAGGDAASGKFECTTDFDCKPDSEFDCKCKFSGTDKPDPKPPKDAETPKKKG